MLSVQDAYNLLAYVDGVLVVLQRGHTTTGDIQSVCEYLEDIGEKLLGFVINQMPMRMDANYSRLELGWVSRIKTNAGKKSIKYL